MTFAFNAQFRPKTPWFGGDLQTMSAVFSPPRVDLSDTLIEDLHMSTDDGTADVLTGQRVTGQGDKGPVKALSVVLLHGLARGAGSMGTWGRSVEVGNPRPSLVD